MATQTLRSALGTSTSLKVIKRKDFTKIPSLMAIFPHSAQISLDVSVG